ncbi:hypothetical protein WA158_006668 [Blastocystis sp. Blastoise]
MNTTQCSICKEFKPNSCFSKNQLRTQHKCQDCLAGGAPAHNESNKPQEVKIPGMNLKVQVPPGMSAPKVQGPPGMNAGKKQGPPGMSAPKVQGPPGMSAPKVQGPPGMSAPKVQGPPGMSAPKVQGPPGMSAPKVQGPPGMSAPKKQGPPGMSTPKPVQSVPAPKPAPAPAGPQGAWGKPRKAAAATPAASNFPAPISRSSAGPAPMPVSRPAWGPNPSSLSNMPKAAIGKQGPTISPVVSSNQASLSLSKANDASSALTQNNRNVVGPVIPAPSESNAEAIQELVVGEKQEKTYDIGPYMDGCRPTKKHGTKGKITKVASNFFRVKQTKDLTFYQYDVVYNVKDKENNFKKVALPADKAKILFETMKSTPDYLSRVGDRYLFTDGKAIAYSLLKFQSYDALISMKEGDKSRVFNIVITITPNVIEVNKDTLNKPDNAKVLPPMDMMHIYKQTLTKSYFGRSVYDARLGSTVLGAGAELLWGYSQAFRYCEDGLFNIMEPTASQFHMGGPLMDLCNDILFTDIKVVGKSCPPGRNCSLEPRQIESLKSELITLKVTTKHLGYERKYGITGISNVAADKDMFEIEDANGNKKKVSVAQYFAQQYGIRLRFPGLPCVQKQDCKLPIEVCNVPAGQRRTQKMNSKQQQIMVKSSAIPPDQRKEKIMNYARGQDYQGNGYLDAAGISIDKNMTPVPARVLDDPTLMYKKGTRDEAIRAKDGQWNLRDVQLYKTVPIKSCGLLILNVRRGRPTRYDSNIIKSFLTGLKFSGVVIGADCLASLDLRSETNGDSYDTIYNGLIKEYERCRRGRFGAPQIIFVFMPTKDSTMYRSIKKVTDSILSVPSQCLVWERNFSSDRGLSPQYTANVALKVNTKLGGMNTFLQNDNRLIFSKNTMILGADVTHPMRGEADVSIAAVVASVDPHASIYIGEARCQKARQEIISDLEEIMVSLLGSYQKYNNGKLPEKLIFYRDGVGDGQFGIVLDQEIPRIFEACKFYNYRPQLTFLIVQKRHNARFFPLDRNFTSRTGNVPAGTVVDTNITDRWAFDFYLNSHNVLQGTGRSGYYTCIYDTVGFNADDLQELTYRLCYLFCRATKSISVCAPARYAHHLAFRHRDILGVADGGRRGDNLRIQSVKIDKTMSTKMYFV